MRLKKIGIIFTFAVALLAILIVFRSGLHQSIFKKLQSAVSIYGKNNTIQQQSPRKTELRIESNIIERFKKLETSREQLTIIHSLEDSTIRIEAAIPRGKPLEWVIWYLCTSVDQTGYHIDDCICEEKPTRCTIRFKESKSGNPVVKVVLTQANRFFSDAAKLAIVVADFGFTANATTVDFLSFPEPLTVSMVSSKKMSTWTAQIANEYHKEIVILLPMEPLAAPFRQYSRETMLIHYPAEKIRSMLRDAAEAIPYHAGFSNLCGSRVLDDSQVMGTILTEIGRGKGYFLIDPVSQNATAAAVARSLDIPYGVVDVSLDSSASSSDNLPDTLRHAAMIALKTGTAILQTRATPQFIATLRSQLPYLQHNGIRLVYLSEILLRRVDDKKDKDMKSGR